MTIETKPETAGLIARKPAAPSKKTNAAAKPKVTPYVYVHEKPTGSNAGKFLQASLAGTLPVLPPNPR